MDDFFDGLEGGFGLAGLAGEVEAGDLEAVEEEAGAFGVDGVEGEALEDFADGDLDGGAVFGVAEVEGGLAAAAGGGVVDGRAGGVVEVAELFAAEAGAAALAAVGVDVAAAEAFVGFGHGVGGSLVAIWGKIFDPGGLGLDRVVGLVWFWVWISVCVKCESPAGWPGFLLSLYIW